MNAHEAIITKLTATPQIVALVNYRFYADNPPDGITHPFIVFQQVSASPDVAHVGASGAVEREFQFACFGPSGTTARAVRDALVAALDGATLANGDKPTLLMERDGDVDDVVGLYRADADFSL